MSFTVYVPCNCARNGTVSYPPFKDKLRIYYGKLDLKEAYSHDALLEKQLDQWTFCEHNGVAVEYDMVQSTLSWRDFVRNKYPGRFLNFEVFIPKYNMYVTSDYDKRQTIKEIDELNELENYQYDYRFQQFKTLLTKAIDLDQEIYW